VKKATKLAAKAGKLKIFALSHILLDFSILLFFEGNFSGKATESRSRKVSNNLLSGKL